jgi:Flp pilus assembly protein TadG
MHALRRLWRSVEGTAAIEFALAAPLMLLVAGGIVEFGLIFKVYNGVDRLAAQYAIAWSDCSDYPAGTCQTELANYTTSSAVSNIAPQLQPSNLTLQMFQVQMDNANNPSIIYSYPSTATLTAAQTSAAQAALSAGQVGVLVTASYQYSLQFFSTLMTPFLGAKLNPSYTIVQLKY